ncbi:MAG: spore coat protein CotH [Erysipelotrichaceae bacterium]|nr:spore coat protein CotH [Erysipelotrichaceae bacterium]
MRIQKRFYIPALSACLMLAGCAQNASSQSSSAASEVSSSSADSYENTLFSSDKVHTIDIELAADDWTDLKANPTDKTKYQADITIDGETVKDVSFATKGNTSLNAVAQDEDSDRYSFKVNFGKYVDGQTYHRLDKLNLNNIYADATYMKDYLSYQIFEAAGLESPLTSYVWLTVNGEDAGLYLAIEDISDAYLDRTEDGEGQLYKPETEQLANMTDTDKQGSQQMPQNNDGNTAPSGDANQKTPPSDGQAPAMPSEAPDSTDNNAPQNFGGQNNDGGNMPGGMGSSDSGASLKYTDDSIDSYSDIFDNAETDASDTDKQRVITALKELSEGDAEGSVDTDSVIAYFAAHNFVMNYDSYTGNMLHNYYLYENDGKLSMIPWDYNLAFGAFMNQNGGSTSSDATYIVNYGIDSPLNGASEADRPMWSWISSNDTYLQKYHEVMKNLITAYFDAGKFEEQINAVYEMILPYVEKDTNGFYDAEEFKTAFSTLKTFCKKRAESISLQLNGSLSTITDEQTDSAKIDASDISISDMGTQSGAGTDAPQESHQNITGI